jgi:hypothetical protein
MSSRTRRILPHLLVALVCGCGGSHHPAPGRAEPDVDAATPRDAAVDAPADAPADARNDAPAEASVCVQPRACIGMLDSFEHSTVGTWAASDWADATLDASGAPVTLSIGSFGATDGSSALQIPVRFVSDAYSQGYVEASSSTSFQGCASLAMDVTLPADAPTGLDALILLELGQPTVLSGGGAGFPLTPGKTTTVTLPLAGTISPSPDRSVFADVHGYGLKVEGTGVQYQGTIALDNVRLVALPPVDPADPGAFSVGTFGAYLSQTGPTTMSWNGFATFKADSNAQGQSLSWPYLGPEGADFLLGTADFLVPWASTDGWQFIDWTAIETTSSFAGSVLVESLLSRAFPAVRYQTTSSDTFHWITATSGRSPMTNAAVVLGGAVHVDSLASTLTLDTMSEPWVLLWAGDASGWPFDVPTLVTFEHRPVSMSSDLLGVTFSFGAAAGAVQVLPLGGLTRTPTSTSATWTTALPVDVLAQCRSLVPIVAAFPDGITETYDVLEASGQVAVTDTVHFQDITDDWGTVPEHVAPVPPAVYRAQQNGYPVTFPVAPTVSSIATYFGPFVYVAGDAASFSLPLPAGLDRLPVALQINDDPTAAPVRAELERIIRDEVPDTPGTYWLGNDEGDAQFMCSAMPTLVPGSQEQQKAWILGPEFADNSFLDEYVNVFTEPVTGQTFLGGVAFPDWDEAYDKEWENGQQLTALVRCAEAVDLDLARGLWSKALHEYRYFRVFNDWATGSVLSSCLGLTELADGINFAWEGMLGMGRVARKLGDLDTYHDAAYRSARQQAALYAAWFQGDWDKQIDYGVGHISVVALPDDEIETRGAIDGWFEDSGSETLEFRSFWETTNWEYFDVQPQPSLYRDFGLESRVHTLEYVIMPSLHPSWTDGNVMDPVDDRYYGSNYTAAHLLMRGVLFHDDPASLFADYTGTEGTAVAQQWYTMLWHGTAGPTLLGIERGNAPVVEAPVGLAQVTASSFDIAARHGTVELLGEGTGSGVVRVRPAGEAWQQIPVTIVNGCTTTVPFSY